MKIPIDEILDDYDNRIDKEKPPKEETEVQRLNRALRKLEEEPYSGD